MQNRTPWKRCNTAETCKTIAEYDALKHRKAPPTARKLREGQFRLAVACHTVFECPMSRHAFG